MVFYRKYRPQTIDDLDSQAVREVLSSVLKKSDTHAFLFTGPKGLGKTSTARIIAKVVNCENRKDGVEPCNTCEQCLLTTNGNNLDVLEIDAASNRGIDEIRVIKERINLSPIAATKKVYIIDEVHMLTTEAFNALLKTLEEPPSHAIFILCTTEPHKVPATIVSRCLHINFKPATTEELIRSFKRIVVAEKIDIANEALEYVANLADRGFRDGAKILEEVVMLADGKKITLDLIEEKYQISNAMVYVLKMLDVFVKKDTKEGLLIIQKLIDQGIDLKNFIVQLIDMLHNLFLVKSGVRTKDEKDAGLNMDEIKILFELLSKANTDMKYSVLSQLPLELAIIDYCQTPQEVIVRKQAQVVVDKGGVTVSSLRKQVGDIKKNEALYGVKKPEANVKDEEIIKVATVELMHSSPNGEVTKEWLDHFWNQLISEIKQHNHTIAGVLRGCAIKSYDKEKLVIQTSYKFHKERLDDMKTREALLKIAKLLTGKDIKIEVELAGR